MPEFTNEQKARKLYYQGWSIPIIAAELNVDNSDVVGWCESIVSTEQQIKTVLTRNTDLETTKSISALERRLNYQKAGRIRATDRNILHLMGAMLYWGEGTKSRNNMDFVNTDPNMLKLFMRFLREEFNVPDHKIRLEIQTHSSDATEWQGIKQYWLDLFSLPTETKVTVRLKVGTTSRKARYPNGMCVISVSSTAIVQQIFGAIQEYANVEKPEWVE